MSDVDTHRQRVQLGLRVAAVLSAGSLIVVLLDWRSRSRWLMLGTSVAILTTFALLLRSRAQAG